MEKTTKKQQLMDKIYEVMASHSRKGEIAIGYNDIGRKIGEANLGAIHSALNQLISDTKIEVIYDNGGRGRALPRIYGIVALKRFFDSISIA